LVYRRAGALLCSGRAASNGIFPIGLLTATSLSETWRDTTTDVGRLMLTIMGGIAEFERGLIRKRCEEGIERAKTKGTRFGRPSALDPGQRRRIAERYAGGETMAADLPANRIVAKLTIWRALQ
jgi:DNA invertase Pin-like site-specific DNA recombinase